MNKPVPNYVPRQFNGIAIIGEAPGESEEREGRPFVGYSGRLLGGLLGSLGIQIGNCYLGNVSQYRPEKNDIAMFAWDGPEIQSGLSILRADIQKLQPMVILLLGNVPLKAALDPSTAHVLTGKRFEYSISNWRGSIFMVSDASSPFYGFKCVGSYHPAACLRNYEWTPLLRFDIARIKTESSTRNFIPPERTFVTSGITADDIIHRLEVLRESRVTTSIDIEGGIDSISCISVAPNPKEAFIIPFTGPNGNYFSSEEDEVRVWRALQEYLEDPDCHKILQNSLYDLFVLAYSYKIIVRGVVDDTMLKHWEAFCELPKGLGFLCSIYTREPYYKHERKAIAFDDHWRYCCRDSATTHEINTAIDAFLRDPLAREHYRFNMAMLRPLLYMELRGIRYNSAKAAQRREEILRGIYEKNYKLDVICRKTFDFDISMTEALDRVKAIVCKKRDAMRVLCPGDLTPDCLVKEFQPDCSAIVDILNRWGSLTDTDKGHLNFILGVGMNIKSPRFKDWLYGPEIGAPKQYNKDSGALSSDDHALLTIYKKIQHPGVRLAIDIARARTRSQMLNISADPDGRIRCGYNVVGTETSRVACYTSPTGSGYNLQTIPDDDRDIFLADEGYDMFSLDLSGADTWTVAAHLMRLGEATMLLDLRAHLKPAKILALMRRKGAHISNLDRKALELLSEEVNKKDWDYFCSKIGVHGTHYLMGPVLLSKEIFDKSDGAIVLNQNEVRELQNLYMHRYRVVKWHTATQMLLNTKPEMRSASGHIRHFFGRRDEILGKALANEPQENTTYATNLAVLRLWNDPENRRPDGSLIIEPLHQVHDALVGQWPIPIRDWAIAKVKSYFQNEIVIAGQRMIIPFEGGYGPSWGETTNPI